MEIEKVRMMTIRRTIYTLTAMLLVLSATAIAHSQEPRFPGLEENSEYMELRERNSMLLEREDSVQRLIAAAREEFSATRDSITNVSEAMDRYSSYIIELEQRVFELRQERGDVITAINNIEQQYILEHMYSEQHYDEMESEVQDSVARVPGHRELILNDIFTELLSAEDYDELKRAEAEESTMDSLARRYLDTYHTLATTADMYNAATTEAEANELFVKFHSLRDEAESLNDDIESVWNHILDTKYYAYGYILERRLRYDLLDRSSEEFSQMQQQCSANDGTYASDALMHYAIGRPTLLDFEIDIAREFELEEALEALIAARNTLSLPAYDIAPLAIEQRLFLDYEPITIGRTNFYNASNPLPALKVYERGTIYRILLGTFRSKQPMTLFKGVQPLYIEEGEDSYAYYAGGFATRSEADEAQLFLKEKGFRRPEVCRWRDGEMINLSVAAEQEDGTEIAPVGSRYIVVMECDSISEEMRTVITVAAPEKRISRIGEEFAVGTFTERSEADIFISTLTEQHPEVVVKLKELDL